MAYYIVQRERSREDRETKGGVNEETDRQTIVCVIEEIALTNEWKCACCSTTINSISSIGIITSSRERRAGRGEGV